MAVTLPNRFRFGEEGLQLPERLQSQDTLAAFSEPSYDTLFRAVQSITAAVEERFSRIEAAAHSRTDPSGESNPRVVKRQYDTLKNTFTNLDMRLSYLEALEAERRHDQESLRQLQDSEQELSRAETELKIVKKQSKELVAELVRQIDSLATLWTSFGSSQEAAEESLQMLDELEQQAAVLQPLPTPAAGPDEAELRALLASEAAQARMQETALASTQAEITELQAARASEEVQVAALRAQVQASEDALQSSQAAGAGTARFEEYLDWCEEMAELYTQLSGVSVLNVSGGMVRLRIHTTATASPASSSTPSRAGQGPECVGEVDHLLLAHMDVKTGRLLAADLVPPTMDLSPLVEQCNGSVATLVRIFQSSMTQKLQQEAS
ncbi:hypothetical protein WJX73_010371 [Symbiochloris irregularis]|uniref:Kinetochore protein SPC25 n=1 Tax=Symbiochloris irregularis TaxID=706552 RepID=A0AAW1NPN3_9CHLO